MQKCLETLPKASAALAGWFASGGTKDVLEEMRQQAAKPDGLQSPPGCRHSNSGSLNSVFNFLTLGKSGNQKLRQITYYSYP
jgi:hypothetical protein